MQLARPYFALDPSRFGRRRARLLGPETRSGQSGLSDDVKLFATTFAAGFLFVTMLIG